MTESANVDIVCVSASRWSSSTRPASRTGAALYLQGFGGDTSNFAIAAARQGARVAYASALGDDPYGRMLRALWDREGVDHRGVDHRRGGLHGHLLRHARRTRPPLPLLPQRLGRQPHGGRRTCRARRSKAPACCTCRASALAISPQACDTAYAAIDMARAPA
jgi:2-dehydro-3-deoxygluconokinase